MALHVQNTHWSHPHLIHPSTSRSQLLQRTKDHIVHVATRDSAAIDPTITHLLSLLPGHHTTTSDPTSGKPRAVENPSVDTTTIDTTACETFENCPPVIDMRERQGQSSKTGLECLQAIAPNKRKRSPSFDSTRNSSSSTKSTPSLSRSRLPPRSRFGCWTCRTRKVKCDEARPKCSPCTRLGHRCDYNPRLSFKDDTSRVVEKMQHLTGQPQGVWDQLLSGLYDSQLASYPRHDFLPPFSSLTNDDDREKKAESRPPGSYNVIITPSSLAQLDEYKANQDTERTTSSAASQSSKALSADASGQDTENNVITVDDPDTVMLRVFEDNSKKLTSPISSSSRFGVSSPSSLVSSSASHYFQRTDTFTLSSQPTPPPSTFEITPQDPRDWPLICHYQNLLSRHLFLVHRGSMAPALAPGAFSTQELFERTVATFPPLYHALMALCALGIAHRSGIQNLDSLQHYQQALPGLQKTLRCPQDLSSDGALLTHFVLLLYEIAAAAPRGSNLWSQHVNQLLRIFVLRSEMHETEPYSFLLWWVCNMDTHALICGTSSGEFVETILQYNMWPTADNVVRLHGSGDCYDPSTEEARAMPAVLDFNRKIEILACRLGLLRRNLQREAESSDRQGLKMSPSELSERQRKVTDIQQALRRTWTEQMPPYIAVGLRNKTLSTRARGIFDNSYILYRACIIYSYTSMYSSQRTNNPSSYATPTSSQSSFRPSHYSPTTPHPMSDFSPLSPQSSSNSWPLRKKSPTPSMNTHHEIMTSSSEIMTLTRNIIASGHHELRFAVFPLFMAGFVLPRHERGQALQLMEGMEVESIGRNTRATRELLEAVYCMQDERSWGQQQFGEGKGDVDWIRMLGERGLQLI
ncbi:MAG: hypothetical protein Q9192_005155 [Flavoplaca navasiana]